MNILVDARPLVDETRGGVSRVSLALLATYAKQFPDDRLFCVTTGSRKPSLPASLNLPNVEHHHLKLPNKLWSSACLFNLKSLQRAFSVPIDVSFFPNLGFTGQLSENSVLLLHDLSFLIEPHWFSYRQRIWHDAIGAHKRIHEATHLLTVSERTKQDAINLLGIDLSRLTVLPLGTTLTALPQLPTTNSQLPARYILTLGARDPRKNAATVKQSVEELRKQEEYKDIACVVVGEGPWSRPTDQELAYLYAHATIFAYPSWYEGYGLPLHEAMQYGTPCVASTAGALPETAPRGTLFANPAKPHHWVEAFRQALASPRPSPLMPRSWNAACDVLRNTLLASKK
jgi:glycosyltransferase involved in cell wall biosynthesis